MIRHDEIEDRTLRKMIRQKIIVLGGNRQLKIYGTLECRQGKRMKKENRVFFSSKDEALKEGFRPCASCLHKAYKNWKNNADGLDTTPMATDV